MSGGSPLASSPIEDSINSALEVVKNNELLKGFAPAESDDKKRKFTSSLLDSITTVRAMMENPPSDSAGYWCAISRWISWISRAKNSKTLEKKFALPEVLADLLVAELPKIPLMRVRERASDLLEKLELTPIEWASLYDAIDDICVYLDKQE